MKFLGWFRPKEHVHDYRRVRDWSFEDVSIVLYRCSERKCNASYRELVKTKKPAFTIVDDIMEEPCVYCREDEIKALNRIAYIGGEVFGPGFDHQHFMRLVEVSSSTDWRGTSIKTYIFRCEVCDAFKYIYPVDWFPEHNRLCPV